MAENSFELSPTVDITKLPLSPEEGVAVARMFGRRVTLSDLVTEGALPAQHGQAILDSLLKKGAIIRIKAANALSEERLYDGVVFAAADLKEAVELTLEQKKRVLFIEMNLTKWHHYELLGVSRIALGPDVKAGYFKVSREFHPDAYFRKNLGSYQGRIDRVFRAMKTAYDVLSTPVKRDQYDKTILVSLSLEEEAELERRFEKKRQEIETRERDERNEKRASSARVKRNPLIDRLRQGRTLMKMANDAHAKGLLDLAANHARLAVSFDEKTHKDRASVIIREADRKRASTMMKRVHNILQWQTDLTDVKDEVNRCADDAAEVALETRDPVLLLDVAMALLKLKRPSRAARLAQVASDIEPTNPQIWEVLAEAAFADAKWAILLKATDRWLALDPNVARPKELQKEAKRNS